MEYKRIILFLFIFVSCFSCITGKPELTEEQIETSEKLASKFGKLEFLVYDSDTLLAGQEVLSFYKSRGYAPVWIDEEKLTDKGIEMADLVKNSRNFGLLPEMFHADELEKMRDSSLLDTEMLLSNAFFLMISHVDVGCMDSITHNYVWKKDSLSFSIDEELIRVLNGEKPTDVIAEKEPKFWEYQQLKKGLIDFMENYPLDTNYFVIPDFKEDSVKCYEVAREALFSHGFLDSTNKSNDSAFIEQLKAFQKLNGLKQDAIVGTWTGKALEKSNCDRFLHAALSMDRWRWKEDTLPERYIRVNVPEFTLYYIDSNKVERKHRVIVGAQKTPTPEFSATMRRMVSNPVWHLPYSISSTEILYAAKKDTGYFRKKGYKIYKNGEEQDPTKVDWSKIGEKSFPYRVKQSSGPGNSLGRLKFLFPNTNYVFIHDTPSKYLFKNNIRAYSHGCIRLEEPFELGKEILRDEQHEIPADTLDSIIVRGQTRVLELTQPFPVFIDYITTVGDSSGNITFHPDIYGRDEKYFRSAYGFFLD